MRPLLEIFKDMEDLDKMSCKPTFSRPKNNDLIDLIKGDA